MFNAHTLISEPIFRFFGMIATTLASVAVHTEENERLSLWVNYSAYSFNSLVTTRTNSAVVEVRGEEEAQINSGHSRRLAEVRFTTEGRRGRCKSAANPRFYRSGPQNSWHFLLYVFSILFLKWGARLHILVFESGHRLLNFARVDV